MYQIFIDKQVNKKIEAFYTYKEINCIYNDTWIESEKIIKENYIKNVKNFLNLLLDELQKLSNWIWWLIINEKWSIINYRKIISIRSYKILVFYTQDKKKKEILITDIIITIKK